MSSNTAVVSEKNGLSGMRSVPRTNRMPKPTASASPSSAPIQSARPSLLNEAAERKIAVSAPSRSTMPKAKRRTASPPPPPAAARDRPDSTSSFMWGPAFHIQMTRERTITNATSMAIPSASSWL